MGDEWRKERESFLSQTGRDDESLIRSSQYGTDFERAKRLRQILPISRAWDKPLPGPSEKKKFVDDRTLGGLIVIFGHLSDKALQPWEYHLEFADAQTAFPGKL